ncbi:MAG TPA: MarR family winged helix-turn-helix transcriptional regulator [Solirubrobacterales bacterium]|nr:MarR family winged helix-turn-helix transcriptional regulator [Solirubrobacterales bacterium]
MDSKIAAAKELALAKGDPSLVTLPALMDLAVEAMYVDFRKLLEETPYTDVRPTHGCVFRFVHGDGMRLTELATRAGLTKQSVGEIVDDLTRLGYIERFPDPTDKRAKLIRLTTKGLDAQRLGFAAFETLEAEWAEAFGADRIAALRTLLEDIALAKSPDAVPELVRPEPAPVP